MPFSTSDFYDFCIPLVGKKYRIGADGPDEFDCFGLVIFAYKQILGIDIERPSGPIFKKPIEVAHLAKKEIEEGKWERIEKPEKLCVVGISHDGRYVTHVGIFIPIDGGTILHADHTLGCVIAHSPAQLRQLGLTTSYYRWTQKSSS